MRFHATIALLHITGSHHGMFKKECMSIKMIHITIECQIPWYYMQKELDPCMIGIA